MPHYLIHLAVAYVTGDDYYGSARCACGFAVDRRAGDWRVALRKAREEWSDHVVRDHAP